MAKSRGRKFAELVAPTNGVIAAASIPTIALSKLANSTFSVNSESASLGGNVELDSNDITEHSSALYFTNTRADTRADSRIAAHNLLARAGGTMTGNLTLGDNVNAYFGASTDLRIYHDGTNSHIVNSTGELRFSGSDLAIKSDSAKLLLGADDDLEIFHDGNNSYIRDTGTGALRIAGSEVSLLNAANSEFMIKALENDAVTLYYDNVAKLQTTSSGVSVTGEVRPTSHLVMNHADNQYIYLGAGNDLQIYHDGSHSFISDQGTGHLKLLAGDFRLNNAADNAQMISAVSGGSVYLYDNNSLKLQTTSTGVQTTGTLNVNGAYSFPTSDGTSGQVLQTDGSGNLTFVTGGGGAGDITAVVAGTNLTGGATSGSATIGLSGSPTGLASLGFYNSNIGAPDTSTHATGTRISLYDANATAWYAIGIESNTMWFNSDDNFKWYKDGDPRLLLNNDVLTFYTTAGNVRGYISATETDDAHLTIATSNNEDIAFKDNGISGTTNFLIRGDGNLYQGAGTNLIWHAGNDGPGSGLDADTLDGVQGSIYLKSNVANTIGNNLTSTAASTSGILGLAYGSSYFGLKTSAQTLSSEYMIISEGTHTYISATSGYNVIIRNGANNSTNQITVGTGATGLTWRGNTVWTAENDGANSGLYSEYTKSLVGTGGISNAVGSGVVEYSGQISASVTGLFTSTNNANGILRLNTHPGNYYHDLGFSSDGNMYHRNFSNSNAFTTAAWYKVWDASNDGPGSGLDADTLDGQHASSFMASTGMSTSADTYINARVIRNSGSSAGTDGMYIGYGNAGSGPTRIYGGGSTSAYVSHNGSNLTFANTGLGAVSMAGTLTSQDVLVSSGYHLQRSNHHTGYLEGSYNNVGANSAKSNPIYSIGSAYAPGDASTGNMYGVGYSHSNFWGTASGRSSNWGFYAVDNGNVFFTTTSQRTWSSAQFNRSGNTVWDAGNDGPGTGLDADTVDGQQASEMTWGHDVAHGTYTDFNSFINTALFGAHFIQATNNSPGHSGATQYYHQRMSLGSNYNNYSLQFAIPRNRSDSYLYYRNEENGSASSWYKMKAGDSDTLAGLSAKGVGSATGASQVLTSNTNHYFVHRSWIDVGTGGIYSATNGAHMTPNTSTSYASWRSVGSRGGYDGIMFDSGGDVAVMFDAGGNGGFYRQASSRWYHYYHLGNNCSAFGASTTSSSYQIYCHGSLYATENIVAYSDRRIKENIVPIDNALEKVNKLAGVYYNKIADEKKTREIGFIAQDVNEVAPELVTYAEDVDQYGVKYANTTALLVEAVKELTQQVKDLKQELEELKNG